MTEKAFVNIFARLLRWSGFAVATVAAVLMVLAPGGSASADFSVVDFRQCANEDNTLGDCHWISSIVQQSNSKYYEGMSVPQRVVFTGITTTSGNVHTLTFTHQATKAGKHAYDWLTSYGQAIAAAAAAGVPYADLNGQACDDEIGPPGTLGATCASLRSGSNFTVDVPDDPFVSKDGSTQSRINAYEGTYGNRTIKIYGNSAFSGASLSLSHSVGNGGDTSDSDINYTLTWTSASTAVLIELAGHLAVSGPAAVAWGAGLGSSQISGGPYHFNLSSLDGTSTGSQDNQIKGADILVATPTVVTDIHNASEQVVTSVSAGTTVHDKATVSGNAGTPTGSVTFTFYTTASNCTGASVASGTVALDGSGVAHPSTSQALADLNAALDRGESFNPTVRGLVFYRNFDYARAEPAFREQIAAAPDATASAEAYYYLAAIQESRGERDAAREGYARANAVNPAGGIADDALWWQARILEDAGSESDALALYDRIVAEYPGSSWAPDAAFRRGMLPYRAGRYAEAASIWAAGAASLGERERLLLWQGKALLQAGDDAGARGILEPLTVANEDDYPGVRARLLLAGEHEQVKATTEGHIDLDPDYDWQAAENWLTRQTIWSAVRVGGRFPWNRYRREDAKAAIAHA